MFDGVVERFLGDAVDMRGRLGILAQFLLIPFLCMIMYLHMT